MRRFHLGILSAIFAGMALIAVVSPADAVAPTRTVNVTWRPPPIVHFTLVPNYASGYGSVIATFGTQPTPTSGPGASLQGGTVDFGTTLAGDTYLYKYAAELEVTTNDNNGFLIYGEAATVLMNNTTGLPAPSGNWLYYLPSTASGDTNTGFTPGVPFLQTSGTVGGNTSDSAPPPGATITYTSYPSAIAQSAAANGNFYYDYQFKVPPTITTGGNFYMWIVYTVVGQ